MVVVLAGLLWGRQEWSFWDTGNVLVLDLYGIT